MAKQEDTEALIYKWETVKTERGPWIRTLYRIRSLPEVPETLEKGKESRWQRDEEPKKVPRNLVDLQRLQKDESIKSSLKPSI